MGLKDSILSDVKGAMRGGAAERLTTLRSLAAQIHNREIEQRGRGGSGELTDEEVADVVAREVKKRREAIELYVKGGRTDLADRESTELAVLTPYLPAQLGEAEIRQVVAAVFASRPDASQHDFGAIMGEVMKQVKGKVDAKVVSGMVRDRLAGRLG